MARDDNRSRARDKFGKPGISFPNDDPNYPVIVREYTSPQSKLPVPPYTPYDRVPTALLTSQDDTAGDNTDKTNKERYEVLPSPWLPFNRYDLQLGPIQGRRRAVQAGTWVDNAFVADPTLVASLTATVKTTYETREGSSLVLFNTEETNSDGTGTGTNPAYPIIIEKTFEPDRGAIEKRTQVVAATGSEIGSVSVGSTLQTLLINAGGSGYVAGEVITLAGGSIVTAAKVRVLTVNNGAILTFIIDERGLYSATIASLTQASTSGSGTGATFQNAAYATQARQIAFQPIDQFKLYKSIETWTIPGPVLTSEAKIDDDGVTITSTRNLDISSNISEGESVDNGVWTITTSEAYSGDVSGAIRRKLTQSRILDAGTGTIEPTVCPILREDKWSDELGVIVSKFSQYVPKNTTEPVIGSSYSTGKIYVSNSITALTVSDPGSGYVTIPALTIEASSGGGTLATATVSSLKVVSASISSAGSGYTLGDTVTATGGTFTTAAILTASAGKLATLAINAPGTGYVVNDIITLGGGASSSIGTVSVSTLALASAAINAAGSGYTSGGTVTLAGGTSTTKAIVSIATLKLVGVSINSGGTGYAFGNTVRLDSGTASVKAVVTVATVDGSGAILTIDPISTAGNYTVTSATHTSTATTGVGTGATFNAALYGILTFTITTAGSYTVGSTTFTQDSATGGGTGATFQTGVFGINTVAIVNGGNYTTPAVATFTSASSDGVGTGATFQNATYKINQLSIATAANSGAYTVIPSSPNAATTTTGTGSGMIVNLNFGIGTVAIGSAGTLYYYPPIITPSYGIAIISPTMSTPILKPGSPVGDVIDTGITATEYSLIKRLVWTAMPLPPTKVEYTSKSYPLPTEFAFITGWLVPRYPGFVTTPPFAGINYTQTVRGVSTQPARTVTSYSRGPSGNVPRTWQVITPGNASKLFPISGNTIHNEIFMKETRIPSGAFIYIEYLPPSSPESYTPGQVLIVDANEKQAVGNYYRKQITTIY
jgi:hypothetical protein